MMKIVIYIALAALLFGAVSYYGFPTETPAQEVGVAAAAWPLIGPVAAARRDLANKLDVKDTGIIVVSVTPRTWADSCLGLPERGEGCAQTRIEGYQIALAAGGATYVYRTDATGGGLRRSQE